MDIVALDGLREGSGAEVLHHLVPAGNDRVNHDREVFSLLKASFLTIEDHTQVVAVVNDAVKLGGVELIVGRHKLDPARQHGNLPAIILIQVLLLRFFRLRRFRGVSYGSSFSLSQLIVTCSCLRFLHLLIFLLLKVLEEDCRVVFTKRLPCFLLASLFLFLLFLFSELHVLGGVGLDGAGGEVVLICKLTAAGDKVLLVDNIGVEARIIIIHILFNCLLVHAMLLTFVLSENERRLVLEEGVVPLVSMINHRHLETGGVGHCVLCGGVRLLVVSLLEVGEGVVVDGKSWLLVHVA